MKKCRVIRLIQVFLGKTRFLNVADLHAPLITIKVRSQHPPWITNDIRQVMRRRDFLKGSKAVKTGSTINNCTTPTRKHVIIYLNRIIKNAKARYFMNTLNNCENNPKEMWKTIDKLTNKLNTQKLPEIPKFNKETKP